MQIQISWLLQKPTDLDLHCLQRQDISRFSRTRVKLVDFWPFHFTAILFAFICIKPNLNKGLRYSKLKKINIAAFGKGLTLKENLKRGQFFFKGREFAPLWRASADVTVVIGLLYTLVLFTTAAHHLLIFSPKNVKLCR